MTTDTVTVHLENEEHTDELDVPTALVDALRDDNESAPEVVGDLATFALAQQAHGLLHHSQGEPPEGLEEAEAVMMDLFEERFGQSYGEMTGHDH